MGDLLESSGPGCYEWYKSQTRKCRGVVHTTWWSMDARMTRMSCLKGWENVIPQRLSPPIKGEEYVISQNFLAYNTKS